MNISEVTIHTTVEYEPNGRNLGPSRRRSASAAISFDGVMLTGCNKMKRGSELFIRCRNFNNSENFVALAIVERSTKKLTVASWKLLDSDRMQLDAALRYEAEKAA